jgi:hypothetical protein
MNRTTFMNQKKISGYLTKMVYGHGGSVRENNGKRNCCQFGDLKPYRGLGADYWKDHLPVFCVHCGQIWIDVKKMGLSGSMETNMERVDIAEAKHCY